MWKSKPPWIREPIEKCELCGKLLLGKRRYRVKLILRKGPLKGETYRTLHVCQRCLAKLKANRELRKTFKIKYRKMRTLWQVYRDYIGY